MATAARAALAAVTLLAAGLLAPHAEGSRARPVGLADMTARAGRIFIGRCVQRSTGIDPATHIPFTVYMFSASEAIKGSTRGPIVFRVPGTPGAPFIDGVPLFEPGEEALLFLYPESPAGFSTPLALGQGKFRIENGPGGGRRAVNATGNARLLGDVPDPILGARSLGRRHSGPIALEDLAGMIRDLAGTAKR